MSGLNLEDIQGFILRGYRMPMVRHYLLKVKTPDAARALLGRLVSGDENDAPQITTAEEWQVGFAPGPLDDPASSPRRKPDYCLNVGITWPGLVALEVKDRVPTLSFKSFNAFVEGAARRADKVGDVGPSAPRHWIAGFGTESDHVKVTLHALSFEAMRHYALRLTALFTQRGAFEQLWHGDGMALLEMQNGKPVPVPKVHFGYIDGIALTPTIRSGPEPTAPDHQQPCEPWLFVLLDEAENYYVPEPPELGRNGSFGVFKIMRQDVVGFENLLQRHKEQIDPELLAAKICGRWRNGVPLALSPDSDSPPGGIKPEQLNDFEYVNADGSGDPKGLRCPIGSHIRRVNPRGQPITGQGKPGGSNNSHRLIRRGIPYGPIYLPGQPDDGIERGLLGYFINSNIENQYEFILKQWVNDAEFVGPVRLNPKSKDVLLANHDPTDCVFEIRQPAGVPTIKITGFSSFTTTQAVAYCFLPSVTALKFIADLK
jgi:deferrochelatase/peroxidase EfeB